MSVESGSVETHPATDAGRSRTGTLWMVEGMVPPLSGKTVRFAAGSPHGLSSNSWKLWVRKDDAYLACRDNFGGLKLSLHQSGRWRFGWTEDGAARYSHLLSADADRAWEKWEIPAPVTKGAVLAFQLIFPFAELVLGPDVRTGWPPVVFADMYEGDADSTVVSVFITERPSRIVDRDVDLALIATLPFESRGLIQLTAHREDAASTLEMVDRHLEALRSQIVVENIAPPPMSVVYFHGHRDNGTRFFVSARLYREPSIPADGSG